MSHFVGAYWGARQESQADCAARLAAYLRDLAAHEPGLTQWFKPKRSRKSPPVAVATDEHGLMPQLKTNRRDYDKTVIAELGYGYWAWTGPVAGGLVSLHATCGVYSEVVCNAVVLSFESAASPAPELLQGALRAVVSAYDPDDAVVKRNDALGAHPTLPVWEAPAVFRFRRGEGYLVG